MKKTHNHSKLPPFGQSHTIVVGLSTTQRFPLLPSHNAQILTTITSFFFVGGRITNIAQFLYDSFIQPFFNHVFRNVIFLYVRCFHFLFSFLIFFFCAQLSVFSGHRKSLLTRIFVSYLYIFHVQVFHTQNLPGEHDTEEHSSINAATGKDRLSIVN